MGTGSHLKLTVLCDWILASYKFLAENSNKDLQAAKTGRHTHTLTLTHHREAFYRLVLFVLGQGPAMLPKLSSNDPATSPWQVTGRRSMCVCASSLYCSGTLRQAGLDLTILTPQSLEWRDYGIPKLHGPGLWVPDSCVDTLTISLSMGYRVLACVIA